jgi:hypothetical protein
MRNRPLMWIPSVTAGLLIAGELLARFGLGLGDPPLSQTHPTIEYLFKPNQHVHRFGHLFATNRYGMRSDDFPPQKTDPRELRVIVYGDSVVNGGNLTDQSRLATTHLRQTLQATLHRPVVVGNASAGSWGPPNELAYLQQFGVLDADIVVLVLSSSDYGDAPTFEPLSPATHPTEKPISALWEGMTRYLPRYLTGTTINESGTVPNPQELPSKRDLEITLSSEREFLSSVHAHGVDMLLIQHWTQSELHSGRPLEGHSQFQRIAIDAGIPVVDDEAKLRAYLESGRNPFRDDIHLNDNGQDALYELLLEQLRQKFAATLVN